LPFGAHFPVHLTQRVSQAVVALNKGDGAKALPAGGIPRRPLALACKEFQRQWSKSRKDDPAVIEALRVGFSKKPKRKAGRVAAGFETKIASHFGHDVDRHRGASLGRDPGREDGLRRKTGPSG